ncbi:Patched family protein [Acanthocheilonema viteae]
MWDSYVEHNLKYPSNIKITKWSGSQYERDMKLIMERTRRLLPLLAFCLVSFCCLSSFKYGCNFRLTFISFYDVLSAACELITAFSFLHITGIHLVQVALVIPFLVLSVGIDDMFIMLSIREQTISASSTANTDVCDLIRIIFRESMVSILLTTIGNIFVFTFGSLSSFPIIRIFCIYSAVSLFIVFLFQLTLFGFLLATKAPNSLGSNLLNFSVKQNHSKSNGTIQSFIQSAHCQPSLPLHYAAIFKNKYFLAFVCMTYAI